VLNNTYAHKPQKLKTRKKKKPLMMHSRRLTEKSLVTPMTLISTHRPSLSLTHARRVGLHKNFLPPTNVSFSKTRREKDKGEGVQKEISDDRSKNETKTVYANMHPMLTRAAVKRCYSDAQVAIT
jgi:hypothetical protein